MTDRQSLLLFFSFFVGVLALALLILRDRRSRGIYGIEFPEAIAISFVTMAAWVLVIQLALSLLFTTSRTSTVDHDIRYIVVTATPEDVR